MPLRRVHSSERPLMPRTGTCCSLIQFKAGPKGAEYRTTHPAHKFEFKKPIILVEMEKHLQLGSVLILHGAFHWHWMLPSICWSLVSIDVEHKPGPPRIDLFDHTGAEIQGDKPPERRRQGVHDGLDQSSFVVGQWADLHRWFSDVCSACRTSL